MRSLKAGTRCRHSAGRRDQMNYQMGQMRAALQILQGHQEQLLCNMEVADRVEAAAKKIQKLTPANEKEKKIVDEALEELT